MLARSCDKKAPSSRTRGNPCFRRIWCVGVCTTDEIHRPAEQIQGEGGDGLASSPRRLEGAKRREEETEHGALPKLRSSSATATETTSFSRKCSRGALLPHFSAGGIHSSGGDTNGTVGFPRSTTHSPQILPPVYFHASGTGALRIQSRQSTMDEPSRALPPIVAAACLLWTKASTTRQAGVARASPPPAAHAARRKHVDDDPPRTGPTPEEATGARMCVDRHWLSPESVLRGRKRWLGDPEEKGGPRPRTPPLRGPFRRQGSQGPRVTSR
ncbi:hypothetical protein HPB47_003001 [Ixodes persulcatus]|uniref:Uncharacterized protein n=1 Tax=Ixodes persulcatus TaxID=34615 RepID=A0AC60PKW4_IXOPE|nr:hypothetical protein HPB47_003001 [Ixodes persulcatus]